MKQPLVSCITPTANRENYIPLCIYHFLKQDYLNKELIILDDGKRPCGHLIPFHTSIRYFYSADKLGTIGTKRNLACEKAKGEIIVQWDDDDYYSRDWISRQVDAQLHSGADLTGLNKIHYYVTISNEHFVYHNDEGPKFWLHGPTIAFRKSFWEQHRFKDIQVGEDFDFVWNSGGKIYAIDHFYGFVGILHAHNTSVKPIEHAKHKKNPQYWDVTDVNIDDLLPYKRRQRVSNDQSSL